MDKLKTTNIKGKEYVEVNTRLKYFREKFAGYGLVSEIIKLDDKVAIIKAIVINDKGVVVAQGLAREVNGDGMVNKTSYVENCETSAWGRALANFGIGIDNSVASADEVEQAIKQQELEGKLIYSVKEIGVDVPGSIVSLLTDIDNLLRMKNQTLSDDEYKAYMYAKNNRGKMSEDAETRGIAKLNGIVKRLENI